MKITYDREANAAYIYLILIEDGVVAYTYPCDPLEVQGMINLDFDREGHLVGIEVLDASRKLPKAMLEAIQ